MADNSEEPVWVLQHSKRESVIDTYDITEKIGEGGFSEVYRAQQLNEDGEPVNSVAIKHIVKQPWNKDWEVHTKLIRQEVGSLELLAKCPRVVQLYDTYEDDRNIFLVMQLIPDSCELFDILINRGWFTEQDSSAIITSIVEALTYVHERGVVHRDIKTENIMSNVNNPADLVLIDFGLSGIIESGAAILTEQCGSPGYVAPEILLGEPYGKPVDLWSLGVTAYVLMAGFPPWDEALEMSVTDQIINGVYDFMAPEWEEYSDVAKDFISRLLQIEPGNRMTIQETRLHPFLNMEYSRSSVPVQQRVENEQPVGSAVVTLITETHEQELKSLRDTYENQIQELKVTMERDWKEKESKLFEELEVERVRNKTFEDMAQKGREREKKERLHLEGELEKLKAELSKVISKKDAEVKETEQGWKAKVDDAEDEMERMRDEYRRELDRLEREKAALTISSKKEEEVPELIQKMQTKHDEDMNAERRNHSKAFAALEHKYQAMLEEKEKEAEDKRKKAVEEAEEKLKKGEEEKDKLARKLKDKYEELEKEIADLKEEHKKQLAETTILRNEHVQRAKEDTEKNHKVYLNEIQNNHEQEIKALKIKKEQELKELQRSLDNSEREHQEDILDITSKYEKKLAELKKEIQQTKLSANTDSEKLRITAAKNLCELRRELEGKMKDMEVVFNRQHQELVQEKEQLTHEVAEKTQKLKEGEKEKYKWSKTSANTALEVKSEMEEKLRKIKKEAEDAKEETRKLAADHKMSEIKLQSELDSAKSKLEQLANQHQAELSTLKAVTEADLKNLKESQNSELASLKAQSARELEQVQTQHKSKYDALDAMLSEVKQESEKKTALQEDESKQLKHKIEILVKQHAEELEKSRAERAAQRESWEEEKRGLKAAKEEAEKEAKCARGEKESLKAILEKEEEKKEKLEKEAKQKQLERENIAKELQALKVQLESLPQKEPEPLARASRYGAPRATVRYGAARNTGEQTPIVSATPILAQQTNTGELEELNKKLAQLQIQNKDLGTQLQQANSKYDTDIKTLQLRTEGLESRLLQSKQEHEAEKAKKKNALNQNNSELQALLSKTQLLLADKESENQRLTKALVQLKSKIPKATQSTTKCPSCGAAASSATAKWCGECGTSFTSSVHVPEEKIPQALQAKPNFPKFIGGAEPGHNDCPAPESTAAKRPSNRFITRRSTTIEARSGADRDARPSFISRKGGPTNANTSTLTEPSRPSFVSSRNRPDITQQTTNTLSGATPSFYAARDAILDAEFTGTHSGKRGNSLKIPFQIYYHSDNELSKQPAQIPFSDIKHEVIDPNGTKIPANLTGGGNSFAVRFTPTIKGQHILKVQIRNIGYTLRVPITGPTSTLSYLKGMAIASKGPYTCSLIAVDADGDAQCVGGDGDFQFSVVAPAGTVDKFEPKDNGDGSYELSMVLLETPVELTKQKKLIGSGEIWKKLKNLKNLKEISCSTAAV